MKFSPLCLTVALALAPSAFADTFNVSYLAAGVQASSASTYVENFNSATITNGTLTTTYNGSGVTGTYTGSFTLLAADAYGGAGGTGKFIDTGDYTGGTSPYTLTLSTGVNYFGLWFSALDAGNQMSFYNGSTLLYTFTPSMFAAAVGTCPSSAYCGNPNNGLDPNEQFAFINFFDYNGTFNKIVFQENPLKGDFESDNHTLANLASAPAGTSLTPTPEPSSLALLGTGTLSLAGAARRRFTKA